MNLFKTISRIKWRSFWRLLGLCITHPFFLWPTYKATKQCMQLATAHFGKKHYQNGQANAFRHALWNILIAKKCFVSSKGTAKSVRWAKKITDWHEEAFFGQVLPMQMDFHNNEVGRNLFEAYFAWSPQKFVDHLLVLTQKAVKMNKQTDLHQLKNQLVYIKDDH